MNAPKKWGSVRVELGVSDEVYEDLLEVSEHRCWICGNEESVEGRRLAVDHDHKTGAVRGLLCTRCNRRLGGTRDPEWLLRAAEYLEVAARAFGDLCRRCYKPAPSEIVAFDGDYTTFEHRCCGESWPVHYATRGVPFGWSVSGVPVPPSNRPALGDPDRVGHPGSARTWMVYERTSQGRVERGVVEGTFVEDAIRLARARGIINDENARRIRIVQEAA